MAKARAKKAGIRGQGSGAKTRKSTRKPKRRTRNPRPGTPKPIRTQAQLGAEFGVTQPAVHKWTCHSDWTFGRGPWKRDVLPQIAAFVATLRGDPNSPDGQAKLDAAGRSMKTLFEAERRKKVAEADAKERENRIADGVLHDVTTCQARHAGAVTEARGRLLQIPSELAEAVQVEGLTSDRAELLADTIRDRATEMIDAALADLRKGTIGPFPVG